MKLQPVRISFEKVYKGKVEKKLPRARNTSKDTLRLLSKPKGLKTAIINNESGDGKPENTQSDSSSWGLLMFGVQSFLVCMLKILIMIKKTKQKCENDLKNSVNLAVYQAAIFSLLTLTFYADDFRSVPFAVSTTLSSGHVPLQEAIGALVTHY